MGEKMLQNQTADKLRDLRLFGMAKAWQEQMAQANLEDLTFAERLGLLIDREAINRANIKLTNRLKKARLQQTAAMEDINFKQHRGLDKAQLLQLSSCQWIKEHHNIIIVGSTGTGKTYLACALAHKACLEGYTVFYARLTKLLPNLIIAKGDGSYNKRMTELAKIDVLILDDWGLVSLTSEQRRDLLEILDDRHNKKSTIVTSQLPVKLWHENINDNTLADAILDRIIHNAYRLELKGESMRKLCSKLSKQEDIKNENLIAKK
jgi:DNA replication protein DnaC